MIEFDQQPSTAESSCRQSTIIQLDSPLSISPATSYSEPSIGAVTPPFTPFGTDTIPVASFDRTSTQDTFFRDAYFPTDDYFLGNLSNIPLEDQEAVENKPHPIPRVLSTVPLVRRLPSPQVRHTGHRTFSAASSERHKSSGFQRTFSGNSDRVSTMSSVPPVESFSSNRLSSTTEGPVGESFFYDNSIDVVTKTESPLEVSTEESDCEDETKRRRAEGRPDTISACWTSPLCPNYSKGGVPPNPATCGGGCAPYLFSNEPLPDSDIQQALEIPVTDPLNASVEPQKTLKRREDSTEKVASRRVPLRDSSKSKKSLTPETPVVDHPEATNKTGRRMPHNQVERKYRESINTQLETLRKVVPSLQNCQPSGDDGDIEDMAAPSKPSKAVILASATAYIKQQEKEKKKLAEENAMLLKSIRALQARVNCEDCSLRQYVMDLNLRSAS